MRALLLLLLAGCGSPSLPTLSPGCHWRLSSPELAGDLTPAPNSYDGAPYCVGPASTGVLGFALRSGQLTMSLTPSRFDFDEGGGLGGYTAWHGEIVVESASPTDWRVWLSLDADEALDDEPLHVEGEVFGRD